MRFYTRQHQYYCGIDLHARTMYNCILDQAGNTVLHKNIHTKPELFLKIIEPFWEEHGGRVLGRARGSRLGKSTGVASSFFTLCQE